MTKNPETKKQRDARKKAETDMDRVRRALKIAETQESFKVHGEECSSDHWLWKQIDDICEGVYDE